MAFGRGKRTLGRWAVLLVAVGGGPQQTPPADRDASDSSPRPRASAALGRRPHGHLRGRPHARASPIGGAEFRRVLPAVGSQLPCVAPAAAPTPPVRPPSPRKGIARGQEASA